MQSTKKMSFLIMMLVLAVNGFGQTLPYVYPQDLQVREKLEKWQDLKFGFMMHWGIYAQLGIVESWALCSEDQSFQDRGGVPYCEFKEMYFGQIKKFNPQQFDPAPWAKATKAAGMKYLVFTTKHHDGFSMWDTKQSDFKIGGPDSPFKDHPKKDIAGEIFKAFREQDFMIGAYFSKADWHHPDYWSPLWATPNRNNNYDIRKYPEKWQRFKDFTFRQIEELMTGYGRMDILWLDAGWVRPSSTINDEVRSWGFDIAPWEQDIDIPGIAKMARSHQPGMLVVDRTVHGPYENYRTPEQHIPDKILDYPWETVMTMSQSWGYVPDPKYKPAEEIIHKLIDIVSKGGNYLLNVGPTPQGTLEDEAYERLEEIGQWMDVNAEAIYKTRPWKTFGFGDDIRFSRSKDNKTLYIHQLQNDGHLKLTLENLPAIKSISQLGSDTTPEWSYKENILYIAAGDTGFRYARVYKVIFR